MTVLGGGRRFAVQRDGEGDPIVLVHGSGVGLATWRGILPRLVAAGRSVHAIELLGYGASDPPADGPVLEADLAGVRALVEGLDRPHVVGHSYGGLLALRAALEVPVGRLSLLEPVAFGILHDTGDREGLADLEGFERRFPELLDERTGGDARWFERFVDYWNGPGAWASLHPRQQEAQLRVGRKVFREVAGVRTAPLAKEALEALTVPVDLVRGERTTVAARRVIAKLAEALPAARVHVLPGVGHVFPLARPKETAEILLTPGSRSPSGA